MAVRFDASAANLRRTTNLPTITSFTIYSTVAVTNGTNMDNWATNELAIVRVRREANHAHDTMTGDAQLLGLYALEI